MVASTHPITLGQVNATQTQTRVIQMPELAYALQSYLEPRHLVSACLVSKTWHRIWTPYLWQTLTLNMQKFSSRLTIHSTSRPTSTGLAPSNLSADILDSDLYVLSEECLGRFGYHIRKLNASWLSPNALLHLSTHCLNLQHIKLQETSIHIKIFQSVLASLVNLRRLELDIPMKEFVDEEEQDELSTNESALLKSIEVYSSASLEHLEFIFQTSVRLPVEALRSMLKSHPALHTIKLVDADIEDLKSRESRKYRKGKKSKQPKQSKSKTSTLPATLGSGLSTPTSPYPIFNSDNEVLTPQREPESLGLVFLSMTSTHTSDTSLFCILEGCSRLRVLHLHSCDRISDTTLEAIALHLPSLSSISLSSCKNITSDGLEYLFKNTHTPLVHAHLCDMPALKDEALEILAQRHCHSLQKLAIYFCAFVTDDGIKTLLTTCKKLRVLGIQASGMTTNIFKQPWACHETLEQLDLQGVFKLFVADTQSQNDNADLSEFSAMRAWRDRQARIKAFEATRLRIKTLSRLKKLRLAAGDIGRQILEGFGLQQKIEVLHLYGLQSSQVDLLPWSSIRAHYPYLKQIYCGVIGALKQSVKDELSRLHIELLTTSSIPDLAFENNFDN
ncbi:hypothetical protein BGZ49_004529 [Haplosporangium sp. Z 27]|nr:hypothetical protein BGZ49_004529 [Haplosporangium sp. Z 27]